VLYAGTFFACFRSVLSSCPHAAPKLHLKITLGARQQQWLKCSSTGTLPLVSFYLFYPEKIISAKFLYLLNSITFAFPKFLG